MPLVLRNVKGSQLTFNEMDGNFTYLEGLDQDKLTTSSFNTFTSSYTTGSFTGSFRGDGSGLTGIPGVTPIATGSFATTGSNRFVGNQIVSGSLILSSSAAIELTVIGNSVLSGSLTISGSTIQSGSVDVSGSINADGFELDATSTSTIPALNSEFNPDLSGSQTPIIYKTLVLNDGKVLVAGRFESIDGHTTNDIARLNSNGSIDTSFTATSVGGGISATSQYINNFVTQSDNKIIIVGSFTSVQSNSRTGAARLNANGTIDTGFSNPGFTTFSEVRDVVIQSDNKIVVVGNFDGGIKRLQTDGTIDASLSVPDSTGFTNDTFYSVALLPSGSGEAILVGGNFQQWNTSADYDYIAKLNPSGSLDTGFAGTNLNISAGGGLDRIKKIKVTDAYSEGDNGYIYIAGRFKDTLTGPNVRNAGFARLNTTDQGDGAGAFDSTFRTYITGSDQNNPGTQYVNDFDFYDGDKILLGGSFTTIGIPGYAITSANRFVIVDQNGGGQVSNWSSDGLASTYRLNTGSVNSVTLLPNDNVLVGGTFTSASNPSTAREGLASLKLTGFGTVTTSNEYSITANANQLLVSSSNTYFSGNVNISGSITGSSLLVSGSARFTGGITGSSFTGSFVGDGSGLTGIPGVTPIATGSFATTGSNVFVGNQTITGSFTAISGSGDLTSSVRFIHNTIAADQGSSVFEVRHRNNTYSENIALKLFADDVTAKMQYEKDGSTVDVLQMGLNNNELFLLQDTRVGFAAGTHKLMVTGSFSVSGSARVIGNSVLSGSVTISGSISQVGVGSSNIIIRQAPLTSLTTGTLNVVIGSFAGNGLSTGFSNIHIGSGAGQSNQTGNNNTFIGKDAGLLTSVSDNTFIGSSAGSSNTTGTTNVFIGKQAGNFNTTANSNTFIGDSTGFYNRIGANNTFVGERAGFENISGSSNTFIGKNSGLQITSGSNNSFLGKDAGLFIADGSTYLSFASASVFLGTETKANANNETNQIVIGHGAIGNGSNTTTIGNTSTTSTHLKGTLNVTRQILSEVSSSLNFANDTAAAAGGVPLGGLYRNGNAIQIRLV
jgi:uncharacterized delta-60 repeat protein